MNSKEQDRVETPLLSVIIPVYNVQDVLPNALHSVLCQGVEALEIILINDGSQDNSLSVCQAFAREDPRIQVIDQQNAGPGAARNAGLKAATGRYISFVDSDDTLEEGALQALLDAARGQQADLVIAHFNILMGDQCIDRGYIKADTVMDRPAFLHALARRPGSYYYSALWNKLYSRQLIEERGLTFDHSYNWGEDFDFNMRYYHHVGLVSFVKKPVYNYRRTYAGQTWRTMFEVGDSFKIKSRLYRKLKGLYLHAGLYNKYRGHIYRYIFNVTLST